MGISAALSVMKASGSESIRTAGGWPPYTFVKDQVPGNVKGEGVKTFGGTWYAVSPSGQGLCEGLWTCEHPQSFVLTPVQVGSGREPQDRPPRQGPDLHGRDVPASQ